MLHPVLGTEATLKCPQMKRTGYAFCHGNECDSLGTVPEIIAERVDLTDYVDEFVLLLSSFSVAFDCSCGWNKTIAVSACCTWCQLLVMGK